MHQQRNMCRVTETLIIRRTQIHCSKLKMHFTYNSVKIEPYIYSSDA